MKEIYKGWKIEKGYLPGYYMAFHKDFEEGLHAKSVEELKTEIDETLKYRLDGNL